MFANLNANNPNAWTYAPDRRAGRSTRSTGQDLHARLTWQALPKLKFGFSDQESGYCACTDGINAPPRPRRRFTARPDKQRNLMGDWTAPLTNNLLIDGAFINRTRTRCGPCRPGTKIWR